jgi:alpha-galactosidase
MIMWHPGEPVERAAFQLLNVMFSVPQVSVRLQEIPRDHFEMVRFYTDYWRRNRAVLLDGSFEALSPNANYPLVRASREGKQIVGLYEDVVVGLDGRAAEAIDVLNAKSSKRVVLDVGRDLGVYRYTTRDSQGTDGRRGPGHARSRPACVHGAGVGPARPRACGGTSLAHTPD